MTAKKSAVKKSVQKLSPYSQGARTDAAKLRLLREKLEQIRETNKTLAASSKKMLRLFT